MVSLLLQIKGRPPRPLGPQTPVLLVGRAPDNDWVIEDPSISRIHAQFEWKPSGVTLKDLGSRNGTSLNGILIKEAMPLKAGDKVMLGSVPLTVGTQGQASVLIEADEDSTTLSHASIIMPAAKLRLGEGADPAAGSWPQALACIHELTLGLIRDVTPQELLEELVEKLWKYFMADRGVVLLRDAQGAVEPQVIRTRGSSGSNTKIRLSHTLVEAALERREALLINDTHLDDPELASKSLILSGVSSVIVTPLEAEGKVIGLLYFDVLGHRKSFNKEDLQLATTLAHVAAAKLHSARLMAEVQKTRAMEQEMAFARAIQQRMVPPRKPREASVDLYAELRPAKDVGGDLYDYHEAHGRMFFCIGDVSGKGVPAALVMAITKTLFRANAVFLEDPSQVMAAVNARIYEETDPAIFVTAFCGFLDPNDGRLVYCNAGHDRPVILAPGRATRVLDTRPGLALGALPGFRYLAQEAHLAPDETLVLYTDGVTEALNPALEEFGFDRLQTALAAVRSGEPERVVQDLLEAVDRFASGAPQADDITLMCLRHRPKP